MLKPKFIIILSSILLFLLAMLLSWNLLFPNKSSKSKRPVVIGSKAFSESIILGEVVALLLEHKFNYPVRRQMNLGGTQVVFTSLQQDVIDVYAEYTGTGYTMILKLAGEKNPSTVYKIVDREFRKRWGIAWSKSLGFNNTYALAVRTDDARFQNIHTISDLQQISSQLLYASPQEFLERKDGHTELALKYQIQFKETLPMEAGLIYSAIANQKIDVAVVYSTDGRIQSNRLKVLKDDKKFFPPYYVSLIAKEKTLKEIPELRSVFKLVKNLIREDEMIQLNDQVDRLKRVPRLVATEFLKNKKLISVDSVSGSSNADQSFLSLVWTRRMYLLKLIKEHLILTFVSLFFAIITSVPIGIMMTRSQRLKKIVFPIINAIQTIPSLALLGFLIPILGIGVVPAIFALFLYSILPITRNTYSGILDIDPIYIEVSRGMGLTSLQILRYVEIPLALPIIIAGVRTATVVAVGTATLAAYIGAGGLGDPIFRGISTLQSQLILLGAIPAATLAIGLDFIIGRLSRMFYKHNYTNYKA